MKLSELQSLPLNPIIVWLDGEVERDKLLLVYGNSSFF